MITSSPYYEHSDSNESNLREKRADTPPSSRTFLGINAAGLTRRTLVTAMIVCSCIHGALATKCKGIFRLCKDPQCGFKQFRKHQKFSDEIVSDTEFEHLLAEHLRSRLYNFKYAPPQGCVKCENTGKISQGCDNIDAKFYDLCRDDPDDWGINEYEEHRFCLCEPCMLRKKQELNEPVRSLYSKRSKRGKVKLYLSYGVKNPKYKAEKRKLKKMIASDRPHMMFQRTHDKRIIKSSTASYHEREKAKASSRQHYRRVKNKASLKTLKERIPKENQSVIQELAVRKLFRDNAIGLPDSLIRGWIIEEALPEEFSLEMYEPQTSWFKFG